MGAPRWIALPAVSVLVACGVPAPVSVADLKVRAAAGEQGAFTELVGRMGTAAAADDRTAAYQALLELGAPAEGAVRDACRSRDATLREHAVALAANRRWGWGYDGAVAALADPAFARRYVGAWALGELGRAEAVPHLVAALPAGGETAKASTRALTKLGPAAVRALVSGYSALPNGSRLAALRVLGDVADPVAAPVLVAALEDPATRAEAVWALGRLSGQPFGEEVLRQVGDPRWEVRLEAARALGSLEYAPAEDSLDRLRNQDPVPAVRQWAARSLAILRGEPQTYPNARGEPVLPDDLYR